MQPEMRPVARAGSPTPESFRAGIRKDLEDYVKGREAALGGSDGTAGAGGADAMRIDLHCHDKNSDVPDETLGRILRVPETWLPTAKLVRTLQGQRRRRHHHHQPQQRPQLLAGAGTRPGHAARGGVQLHPCPIWTWACTCLPSDSPRSRSPSSTGCARTSTSSWNSRPPRTSPPCWPIP